MADRAAFALLDRSDPDLPPARQEAIDFARYLARRRVRAMMAERTNDSAPRK